MLVANNTVEGGGKKLGVFCLCARGSLTYVDRL